MTDLDVRKLREERGWTQADLAEFLGVDRSTVSRIESGQPIKGPVRKLLDSLKREAAE